MLREAILSAVLHLLVIILLITGLPHLFQRPVEPTPIIPVEIVNIADVTQAPLPKAKIDPTPPPPMPQNEPEPEPEKTVEEKKTEPVKPKPVEPKPVEPKPEPVPVPVPVPAKDAIDSLMDEIESQPKEEKKEQKKEAPKEKKKPKKSIADAIATAEQLEKTAIQEGNADISPHNIQNISDVMTVTEIDLIRQQLKDRWNVQGADRNIKELTVDIYVEINPDATVRTARIVGSNLPLSNPTYQAFANSALRAVTKPEPLKIPQSRRGEMKVFIITFSGKDMF